MQKVKTILTDRNEIRKNLKILLNIPIGYFMGYGSVAKEAVDKIMRIPAEKEGIEDTPWERLTYLDLLCLIDNVKESEKYGDNSGELGFTYTNTEDYYWHLRLLYILIFQVWQDILRMRIFLETPLKCFYEALEDLTHTGKHLSEYREIIRAYMDLPMPETAEDGEETVGNVLKQVGKIFDRGWCPTYMSITYYERMIKDAYDIAGRILVDSFKYAFPERFNVTDVCTKAHILAKASGVSDPFMQLAMAADPEEERRERLWRILY